MNNPRQHSIQRRMVEVIDRQLATPGTAGYILEMGSTKLRMVRSFITSFTLEDSDGPIPLMTAAFDARTENVPDTLDDRAELQSENHVLRGERDRLQRELDELRGMAPNTPAGAELAARLDEFEQRTVKSLNAHDERFATQSELRLRTNNALHQRIDKVVDIIGTRVEGLVNDIAVATDSAKLAHERLDNISETLHPYPPAFPTGGASTADYIVKKAAEAGIIAEPVYEPAFPTGGAGTAEAVAEAVLPVPQRGDRVRLEGALTTRGTPVKDGWYDVVGSDPHFIVPNARAIQISVPEPGVEGGWLPWLYVNQTGLKEVRHAQ